ncbi:unnamed protein product [Polarella glacialis]|uniref:Uncharacterized protein n=1 Tax=Polarella glacialis TaxID=89957 RepID=A0A813E8X8_POLGL|nr:unnamed protein product [Polarella glacialis]
MGNLFQLQLQNTPQQFAKPLPRVLFKTSAMGLTNVGFSLHSVCQLLVAHILVALILGGFQLVGAGRNRSEDFLLTCLQPSTQLRYQDALQNLNNALESMGVVLAKLPEEEQDWLLAEWVLDGFENARSRGGYGLALSALSKINPRAKHKVEWPIFDVWGKKAPPVQAPAAPPELSAAMIVAALLLQRPELIVVMMSSAGLLRVREALSLRYQDVVVGINSITLCLGSTKGGLEQKVVLASPSTVKWVLCF